MRVLVVGPAGTYSARGFAGITHGSHVRPVGLARSLAAAGAQASLLDQCGDAEVLGVRESGLGDLSQYDSVVVAGIAGLWRLRASGHYVALCAHPNPVLVVDTVYGGDDAPEHLGFAEVLVATSRPVAAYYAALRGGRPTFHAPWGCSEAEPGASPWPDDRPRVLFAGIVYERFAVALNALAEALAAEVWVAGVFHHDGRLGGLTAETRRALLSPRVHLATDVLPATPHGDGPVVYADVCRMAAHATVGVNLVPSGTHGLMGTSCKIYDYLGMGLPVVSEPSPASDPDITALGAGLIVPWGDTPGLIAAVRSVLDDPPDRARLQRDARAALSWGRMAREILSHVRQPSA
jgi:glycosyltransferase involved in cell wall biosynthesis